MIKSAIKAASIAACIISLPSAYSAECTADVENVGAKLSGNTFFTTWRIQHDAGRSTLAKVFFEYKVQYKTKTGANLVERGVFNNYIKGQGKQYSLEKFSGYDPVDIISVDYDNIQCST